MRCLFGALLVILSAIPVRATGPFLRTVTASAGTNLLRNADFEVSSATTFSNWSADPNGFRVGQGEGRQGSTALACDAPDEIGWRGAHQSLALNRTVPAPLVVRGWSRAEGVSGGADSGYSLYVDIVYQDGTPLWGQTANFSAGTHDWQQREIMIVPEKPVKTLTLYCILRGHSGRVWFDDVAIEEITASGGAFVYQGTPMTLASQADPPPPADVIHETSDGLRMGLAGSRVVSVRVDDRELAATAPGGFLARDVAAESDVYGFADGVCAELGLTLQVTVKEHADHLAIEGRLTNSRGGDRAILLLFALPVDAAGWTWGDDIRRRRTISGTTEFFSGTGVGCGTTGTMSLYPLGAIQDSVTGLALAIDMAQPAVYRLVCHPAARQLLLAWDFGLVPDTTRFPNGADFRFVIYRFDPRWGFRAALDKLTGIFPDYFRVRSTNQGIWMPFTDVSTVQDWADFGFRYHEGDNNVGWDDQHEVLSFRYTEPMTWWMSMAPDLPRTEAEALRARDAYAAGPPGRLRDLALVSQAAGMFDADGHPALVFRNEPWANGAVWSLNPNPFLPAIPNAATIHWNDSARARYAPTAPTRLDGEYLDSLEGYVTANLNLRRDHFPHSTVPLAFTSDTHRPALFKGLAIHEFTRWISEDVHRLGGLMFANSVPYRFGFLCPWLDIMGTETDWMPGGIYRPVADTQLCLWRSLVGRKPYLLLMNTDYTKFTSEWVERYFLRCLAYGMFPSMFSHNASENPYWQNPTWYNRDRALFKKYIPMVKEVAEAGWQPITAVTFDAADVPVERFGAATNRAVYVTLLNDAAQAKTGMLRPQQELGTAYAFATELVSGRRLDPASGGWSVTVPAQATAVVKIETGPRFLGIEPVAADCWRLTIASPPALKHVIEESRDLKQWSAVVTNTPTNSPFAFEVVLPAQTNARFLRIRW